MACQVGKPHSADQAALASSVSAARCSPAPARPPPGELDTSPAPDSLQAAARLGVRLTGDWAESWNRVRQVTIHAVYTLIDELDPG